MSKLTEYWFLHWRKTEDFVHAARILKGRQVKVPTYLVPATQKVYEDLFTQKYDGKRSRIFFLQAGCIEPAARPARLVWVVPRIPSGA